MPSSYIKPLKMLIHKTSSNGVDITVPLRHATQITIPHTSATSGNPLITYKILSRTEKDYYFLLDLGGVTQRSGSDEFSTEVYLDPYFTERFDNSDFNAIFNNAIEIDTATTLQKVDYSTGPIPTNLQAIRDGKADKAEVQEYIHGSIGMRNGRYLGKELTGARVNEYTDGDISYGRTPVLENQSIYFTYFNEIADIKKELLNHVRADIRYIVDKEGTYRDITLESADYYNLQQSLPEGVDADVSLDSTTYLGFNMTSVNGAHRVRRTGAIISPVIYSHTSSYSANWTGSINFGDSTVVDDFRGVHTLATSQTPTYVKKDEGYVVLFDKTIKQKPQGSYDITTGEYTYNKTPEFDVYFNVTFNFKSLDNTSRKERFEPIVEWYDNSDNTWKQLQHVVTAIGGTTRPVKKADQAILAGTAIGASTGAAVGVGTGLAIAGAASAGLLAITGFGLPIAAAMWIAIGVGAAGAGVGALAGSSTGALVKLLSLKDPYEFEVDGRSSDNLLAITAYPKLREKGASINILKDDLVRVRVYSKTGDFEIQRGTKLQILQEKDPAIAVYSQLLSLGDPIVSDPYVNGREYIAENLLAAAFGYDTLSDAIGLVQAQKADGYSDIYLPFDIRIGDEIRFSENESRTHTVTEVYKPGDVFERQGLSGTTYTSSGSLIFRVYPPIPSAYTGSNELSSYVLRRFTPDPKSVILAGTKPSGSTSGGILKPHYITPETNETLKAILPNLRKDANN
jgi:hypothetical protein